MSRRRALSLFRIGFLVLVLLILGIPSPAYADSFVINTPDDNDDGLCDANHCSLREAINAANNNPGPDTISFADLDATGGDVTISLNSFLNPLLDDGTTIDGTTVLGYTNEPVVNIVKAVSVIEDGIAIQSNNNVVRGLSFAGFGLTSGLPDPSPGDLSGGAIAITGSGNLVESNVIGWGGWPNTIGVNLAGGGNNVIGNVISGNIVGIYLGGPNQVIKGNNIGTDASGTTAIPNSWGICNWLGAAGGHVIGGPSPGDRNLVSGNNKDGITLSANNNTVLGNFIGTNAAGTGALGNGGAGIRLMDSDNNQIGSPGAGNLVSGNEGYGILISSSWENANNVIQANVVGTDVSGTNPIPNQRDGIFYIDGGGGLIGGLGDGEGNITAFNAFDGIEAEGPDQQILGNTSFSNGVFGVEINGNTIISQNSIYDNGDVGIFDSPCCFITPPVLSAFNWGSASGTACPNCVVEIFLADPDPTGAGEGKEYLGSVVTTSNGEFSLNLPPGLPFCGRLTATATEAYPKTSPFSQNASVNCFKLGPYYLIPIWSFIITVFGLLGFIVRRRRPGMRFAIPGGLLIGAIFGGGLLWLADRLPAVQIELGTEPSVPYAGQVPSCSNYLDPGGLTPQDGALLAPEDEILLAWTPAGDLPEGELRWIVELEEVGVGEAMQTTQQNQLPMSAFGMTPSPGGSYEWLLQGQRLLQDGVTWLPFCASDTPWTYAIEQPAEAEPELEEEPQPVETEAPDEQLQCISPLIEALMNLTCRIGPNPAYEEKGYLLQGETAVPEGVSEDGTWFWIPNPDWQGYCFVWGGGVVAECVEGLLPIEAPPLPSPTPTEPACLPTFDRAACGEAGGVWSADTGTCQCP